jgi:thiol:disulfide interchange protein DsbD
MLRLILSILPLLAFLTPQTHANPVRVEAVEAQLIVDSTTIPPGQPFWGALVLRMDPKWHTYWINPGDSGYAAQMKWDMDGFKADDFRWPTPKRLPTPPLMSYGYEDEVVLPVRITPPATMTYGQTYKIGGTAHWLMCKDICLPGDADLFVEVTAGTMRVPHDVHDAIIQTTLARLPGNPLELTATADYGDTTLTLTIQAPEGEELPGASFVFIPATEGVINDSAEQKTRLDDPRTLVITVERDGFNKLTPDPLDGLIVSASGLTVSTISAGKSTGSVAAPALPSAPATVPTSLLIAALMAFVGGLILNLMPCVLPVLSIKVLHVMQHAKVKDSWKHGVAFTLGVTATFLLLVAVLEVLKAGGSHIGWGFQLQSPVFVAALAVVLTVVALDLLGVFEIGLSLTRMGNAFDDRKGFVGSFLTGILATVVATPCTAPFMGSAIAYSLGQDTLTTALIFVMLGLGLSAPYLVLTSFPRLLRFVPKPGAWMETFKQLLAFPVLATVVWLAWVLGLQTGTGGLITLLTVLLAVGFVLWIYGKAQRKGAGLLLAGAILALVAGMTAYGSQAIGRMEPPVSGAVTTDPNNWLPYTTERLNKYRTIRRPVFVVYTAAWCITCKVNERLVLRTPETLKLFADNGVEVLVADWTKRDAFIADELAKFGRNGIPFYVYYPPQGDPVPLPEVITHALIKQTIDGR